MPVFISHRTLDDSIAEDVRYRLENIHHIECWTDDVNAQEDPNTITEQILVGINKCTHLIGVITDNTVGSWWVPYEIGVAQQALHPVASYSNKYTWQLPEYLRKWPVLKTDSDIDEFARIYKSQRVQVANSYGTIRNRESITKSAGVIDVTNKQFENTLKRAIGQ